METSKAIRQNAAVRLVIGLLALAQLVGCRSSISANVKNGAAVSAASTAGESPSDPPSGASDSTGQVVVSGRETKVGPSTPNGLVVVDGALAGLGVKSGASAVDDEATVTITLDAEGLPLTIDVDPAPTGSIEVTLPSSMLAGIDLSRPGDVVVYLQGADGVIKVVDASLVSITDGKVVVTISENGTLGIGMRADAFAFTLATDRFKDALPTFVWAPAPIGAATAIYEVTILDATCSNVLSSFETTGTEASPAASLADGSYCLKLKAKIGTGVLPADGDPVPFQIDTVGPPTFALTTTSGTSANNLPTVTWDVAPHAVETSVSYELKLTTGADCSAAGVVVSDLVAASHTFSAPLADGAYKVCVDAEDELGNVTAATSSGTTVLTIDTAAPAAFTMSGTSGASTSDPTPTITWQAASDLSVVTYAVAIDDSAGGCPSPVQQQAGVSGTAYTASALAEGLYYVCVQASDAGGLGPTAVTGSGVFTIRVDTSSPAAFAVSGSSGAYTTDTTPTVSWGAAADVSAVTYSVKLDTDSGCPTPAAQSLATAATSFTPASALADGTYHVCLTAVDAASNPLTTATNSDAFTVIVDATPPGTFSITGPSDPTSDSTPDVTWGAASDSTAVEYTVDVRNAACSSIIDSATGLSATSYTVSVVLTTANDYCVRVVASDAAGNSRNATNNGYLFSLVATKPSAPTAFTASMGNLQLGLAWTAGVGSTGTIVIRKASSAVDWVPTDGDTYSVGAANGTNDIVYVGSATSMTDTGLTNGTNYHYAAYAYNAAAAYSVAPIRDNETPNVLASGDLHLIYGIDNTLHHRSYGTVWSGDETIHSAMNFTIAGPSLDKNNKLHLGMGDQADTSRYYTNRISGTWSAAEVAQTLSIAPGLGVATAMDSTDQVHYAYAGYASLYYEKGTAGSFGGTVDTIFTAPGIYLVSDIKMSIDDNDKPHLVFVGASTTMGDNRIFYANKVSGSWVTSGIEDLNKQSDGTTACTTVAVAPDLAIDSAGKAHITYNCMGGMLIYATNASGSWAYSQITYSGLSNTRTAIALDSTDKVHVAYPSNGNNMNYATYSGSWTQSNLGGAGNALTTVEPIIGLDSADAAHVIWVNNEANPNIKYSTNSSASWVTSDVVVDVGGSVTVRLFGPLLVESIEGRSNH